MITNWKQLRGHHEQRALFERSRAAGRLSHAYMLCGPDGIGKYQFARLLAQSMFCRQSTPEKLEACGECRACKGFLAGSWPDYIELRRPDGKSDIPIDLLIGDKERRGREGLCYELSMAPQASDRRVAVIDEAHYLNAAGANALLKTLEEPPSAALILLICRSVDSMIPTIRSRSQVIRFFPLSESDVASVLVESEMEPDAAKAREIAAMADGSLTMAHQLMNETLRSLKDAIFREMVRLEEIKPLVIAGLIADQLDQISKNTEEERRNALWLLRFVVDFLQKRLRSLTSGDFTDPLLKRFGVRDGVDLLASLLQRVHVAVHQIEGNAAVRLVLEAMFDELARQIRLGPPASR